MPSHISDSLIYGSSWGTAETRALFDDEPRTRCWLSILAALAESQAEVELIPKEAAAAIARTCRELPLDDAFFAEVREGFETSNHTTLGLIQTVQKRCPGTSGEWLYYGATVQDVTDTWTMLVLRTLSGIARRELEAIENQLLALAKKHRDTVMSGRTHGQPGLPITFGYKVAVWAREFRRHRQRLEEMQSRLGVGQLCGGVGSLSSLGPRGFELQESFLKRLGLRPPDISWIVARDVLVEWFQWMSLVSGTSDKLGHEVYNLQRSEIGEVSEGFVEGTVGSITMPHKRNPEISEHLGTLARVVRHNAALVAESQVHDHERDGRAWKSEFAVFSQSAMAFAKILELVKTLAANLVVHPERAMANLEATRGFVLSESVMLALAKKVGKQSAHRLIYEAAMRGQEAEDGRSLKQALLESEAVREHLSEEEIESLLDYRAHTGLCRELVDRVLNLSQIERAGED